MGVPTMHYAPAAKPASKGRRHVSESTLVTAILKALKLKGIFCWRVNSGLTVFKAQGGHARRVVKGAEAGSPDIMLVLRRDLVRIDGYGIMGEELIGQLAGLEVKTAIGKQSPTQKDWQAKAERHGVRYAVVRSIGETLAIVQKWQGGT